MKYLLAPCPVVISHAPHSFTTSKNGYVVLIAKAQPLVSSQSQATHQIMGIYWKRHLDAPVGTSKPVC